MYEYYYICVDSGEDVRKVNVNRDEGPRGCVRGVERMCAASGEPCHSVVSTRN